MDVQVGDCVRFDYHGRHVYGTCVGIRGRNVLIEHTDNRCINQWTEYDLQTYIQRPEFTKRIGFNYWLLDNRGIEIAYSLANKTGISHKLVQMYGE